MAKVAAAEEKTQPPPPAEAPKKTLDMKKLKLGTEHFTDPVKLQEYLPPGNDAPEGVDGNGKPNWRPRHFIVSQPDKEIIMPSSGKTWIREGQILSEQFHDIKTLLSRGVKLRHLTDEEVEAAGTYQ